VTEDRRDRWWRVATVLWTALAVALVAHQVYLWTGGMRVDTDVLQLLPRDERDEVAQVALSRLASGAAQRVVVLVGAGDEGTAARAADAYLAALPPAAKVVPAPVDTSGEAVLRALEPFRQGLLGPADRARLEHPDGPALAAWALAQLQQPVARRLGSFREDPLGTFARFLEARAADSPVRPRDGRLFVDDGAAPLAVLLLESAAPAFSFDGARRLEPALEAAATAARAAGATRVLAAGVPRFAEAAAAEASAEVSVVGLGSMLAILVVMWLAFRSLRPLVLVAATVGLGVAAGLSACVLAFGSVHLVTLVFGASLVGVAEDFGIHYFANRQAAPLERPTSLLWHHLPALTLALATSIAGYAMLAVAPFPGLRQVALFSGVGLAAAFAGAVAWFPFLDGGGVRSTRFATAWAATRSRWPVVRGRRLALAVAALVVMLAVGLSRLTTSDDLRELQHLPPGLLAEQLEVGRLMGLSSPAQFFVVRGRDEGEVLAREEALGAELDGLVARRVLTGYDAVSAWVPSPGRQAESRRRFLAGRALVLKSLSELLEDAPPAPVERPWRPLQVADVLATPLGERLGLQWLEGPASVVMVRGLGRQGVGELEAAARRLTAGGLPVGAVRFVDRTGELSALLGRSRVGMTWLLLLGYALVFAALWLRFRRQAWRALAPTLVSSLMAVAAVGLLGEPFQLFHVLALWLLLGMGVDYGIFLLEHPSRQAGEAWLAVGLGAVSTLLSFGLLAASSTPAIHGFGLAMAVGVGSVWALSPLFCDEVS
jgi:predicted exporter